MTPLARKIVAAGLAAELALGGFPAAALGEGGAAKPAEALRRMGEWGVFKDDDDVLKSYFGDGRGLTPLGKAVYDSLLKRYGDGAGRGNIADKTGLADELASFQPAFDRLRERGPYNQSSARGVERTLRLFREKYARLADGEGSVEGQFQAGALREALMTGAAVVDPPRPGDMIQVRVADGVEFRDRKGVAYRLNRQNATTYNRELQKNQRLMNQSRPPQVPFIPETGRYNPETFAYSYWRLKNQYDALREGMRRDRMIALAELLGEVGRYREDMWLTDKTLEADLVAKARAKTYDGFNLLDYVDAKFKRRAAYLDDSREGVERFKRDLDRISKAFKKDLVVADAQAQTLSLDEQYALKNLSLGVLETQYYYVKSQMERLDPSSPDSEQLMKAVDASRLTPGQKANLKLQLREKVSDLESLRRVLDGTRVALEKSDYAGSLDMANAALTASQKELARLSAEYSMYAEVPAVAQLGRQQADVSWLNFGSRLTRGLYRAARPNSGYAQAMRGIDANLGKFDDVLLELAEGKTLKARQDVIAMNPDATRLTLSAPVGGDQSRPRITDADRLAASLKVNRDRIGTVFETNKWLDSAGGYINWAGSLALGAPAGRLMLNGGARLLAPLTAIEARANAGFAMRAGIWTLRRGSILTSEMMLHTAARLETLDPSRAWVHSRAQSLAGRYLLASSVRGLNAATRQASFTGLSGGISGAFTLGTHLVKHEHSMFGGSIEAFWTGAKGGVWWANSGLSQDETSVFHFIPTAALGYVGLPSTAFRDTKLLGAMEVAGARGVMGTSLTGLKYLGQKAGFLTIPAGEQAVTKGFLETMAEKGWRGKVAAFGLGMTDNVAKYALFSEGLGWAGRQYGYGSLHLPFVGDVGRWGDETDLDRRLKRGNVEGEKWLMSPAWLLIPTFAAHQARDASLYQRSMEGMKQFDEAGLTADYANAGEGSSLRFLKTPKTPLSQHIFETSFFSEAAGDSWVVTSEVRRKGIQKEMIRMLAPGKEGATAADINPMEFLRATKLGVGNDFLNLKVTDDVISAAHKNFVESLIANPKLAKEILAVGFEGAPPLGSKIEGFGRVTPEVRKDVAVALDAAPFQIGKNMPKELAGRVGEILKPYLESNRSAEPEVKAYLKALAKAPKNETFGAVLDDVLRQVSDWKANKSGGRSYSEFLGDLRSRAEAMKAEGKIGEAEHEILSSMYDYVDALDRRFNSFNNVEKARELAGEALDALKVEHQGREKATRLIDFFQASLDRWAAERSKTDAVDGPRSDGSFRKMVDALKASLEKSKAGLSASESAALKGALDEMAASPWVLHDSKGTALPGWRPEQFESLMGALTAFSSQGRAGGAVRLFQLLKTGGGKTFLAFEGLLPLVEADAAANKMKPMFLTVQSNLEAQARMEFIAYKKIGSRLDIDTYEGFKTKIAEGRMKGGDVQRDYWIMGDEMDGAALQPALTIGQVSGYVSRRDPVYNRIEELDTGLANRVDRVRSARDSGLLSEARRAQSEVLRLEGPGADAARDEAKSLVGAAKKLGSARGLEARRLAEAEVSRRTRRLESLLEGTADASQAREALGRLKKGLSALPSDSKFRETMVKELAAGFKRQGNLLELTGSEAGLNRLAVVERSLPEGAGPRLANLQEKIAGARSEPGSVKPERLAEWTRRAEEARQALTPEVRAEARAHEEALSRLYEVGREVRELDSMIADAAREGRAAGELEVRRAALEGDFATLRAEAWRAKARLSEGFAPGSRPLEARLAEARSRLKSAADAILAEAREGKPGWEDRVRTLLERRRSLMEAFAGDENPLYTVFRGMKDDMQSFAMNSRLRSPDPAVYKPAQRTLMRLVEGEPALRFAPKLPRLLYEVFAGKEVSVPIMEVGLTRLHAARMLKALLADPTMPAHQRDSLFWNAASSMLRPGEAANSSWVRTELLRQLHGFFEDPAGIRLDHRSNRINVVHNGQWFESMDNETRRFWELMYDVDLTLPYTHQAMSTIKNITTDKETRFISFSGTAGEKLRDHFRKNDIRVVGEGSKPPEFVEMAVVPGPSDRFSRISEALARKADADGVVVRPKADAIPDDARPAVEAYLKNRGLAGKDDVVVRISDVKGATDAETEAARSWLNSLRANQKDTGLVVLSVSDTRVLKSVREHLIRKGLKPDEIAMVFSDTEYLRGNVPEAEVGRQMNLKALDSGKALVLILDTRVGGRGLDLNFKGERGSLDPKSFRGYTDFEMLIVDPQKMSQVHLLQAEGRIDLGRVLPAARRDFSLVMDVRSVKEDRVFRDMITQDPFFQRLRSDPKFQEFARSRGAEKPDWTLYDAYVRERAADGSADGALLAESYRKAVKDNLEIAQGEVEAQQLQSSSVGDPAERVEGRFPGIEMMR